MTVNIPRNNFSSNFKKLVLGFIFTFSIFNFSYAAYDIDLKLNSSGLSVIELQNFLIDKGYLKATANGNYGPATTKAVKNFQKKNKIKQTGTFGPGTRTAAKKEAKNILYGRLV